MNRQLNTFESALLTELRDEVEARAAAEPAPAPAPVRAPRTRRRWAAVGGVLGAAGAAAAGAFVLSPTPAFSVTEGNGGTITVEVNRLEGASALERALAEHGVTADVTYLEPEQQCAQGRYAAKDVPGLSLSVGDEWFVVEIPPGAVVEGDTFVLSAAVRPHADGNGQTSSVDFGIATGAVSDCTVEPADWSGLGG